jgi:hypothetical protein
VLVCDALTMLVTGEPVTELDAALGCASTLPAQVRGTGDVAAAERLAAWIDQRLDERLCLR